METSRYLYGVSPNTYEHLTLRRRIKHSHKLLQALIRVSISKRDFTRIKSILLDQESMKEQLHKG